MLEINFLRAFGALKFNLRCKIPAWGWLRCSGLFTATGAGFGLKLLWSEGRLSILRFRLGALRATPSRFCSQKLK
jgi:hypothetical protein